jgi:multicomponent K+:H+ antiporter subunit F
MNEWPVIPWALDIASACVGMALDRALALDTMYINVVALVILLGMRFRTELLFEAALIIALLGFASTVALARYLSRGDVIE